MAEITITSKNYEAEVLNSDKPVFIDFWATWCGPCRMMAPVVEKLAEEYEGKMKVCKVNVDDEPELAREYGIMSIPFFALIENGELKQTAVGYMPADSLKQALGI